MRRSEHDPAFPSNEPEARILWTAALKGQVHPFRGWAFTKPWEPKLDRARKKLQGEYSHFIRGLPANLVFGEAHAETVRQRFGDGCPLEFLEICVDGYGAERTLQLALEATTLERVRDHCMERFGHHADHWLGLRRYYAQASDEEAAALDAVEVPDTLEGQLMFDYLRCDSEGIAHQQVLTHTFRATQPSVLALLCTLRDLDRVGPLLHQAASFWDGFHNKAFATLLALHGPAVAPALVELKED